MNYFESHAHYDDRRFQQDREALLKDLPVCGIEYVINIGCDLESSCASIELADTYDYIYATVGVHPHELSDMSDSTMSVLRRLAGHEKVVGLGEFGLDYHYDTHPKAIQKEWFIKQLNLAKELNKPVIIHSREASQDTFDIIQKSGHQKGVIHCYSGNAQMAMDYVKMGYYIGIGGVITFSNAKKMVEVVKAVPLERILIETDSPYLSPNPNRGKRNDSRNLAFIVEKIAEIKGVSPEVVAEISMKNGKKLFFK